MKPRKHNRINHADGGCSVFEISIDFSTRKTLKLLMYHELLHFALHYAGFPSGHTILFYHLESMFEDYAFFNNELEKDFDKRVIAKCIGNLDLPRPSNLKKLYKAKDLEVSDEFSEIMEDHIREMAERQNAVVKARMAKNKTKRKIAASKSEKVATKKEDNSGRQEITLQEWIKIDPAGYNKARELGFIPEICEKMGWAYEESQAV